MSDQDILMEIRERLVKVETLLTTQIDLREKVNVVENKIIENTACIKSNIFRITQLEGTNVWLWRTVIGAIITTGIGILLCLVPKGGGG